MPSLERRVTSPRINRKERDELILDLATTLSKLNEEFSVQRQWGQVRRYMGVIALVGALDSNSLRPNEAAHTRKMVGLEAVKIRERVNKPKKTTQMWAAAREVAGPEINQVRNFGDQSELPKAYQIAEDDLEQIKGLSVDPHMLALRQTVRQLKRQV